MVKISLHGNIVHREKPKFADYVLYVNKATPIAIIEAKDTKHTVSYGLQQAMEYAKNALMSNLRSAPMEKVLQSMIF